MDRLRGLFSDRPVVAARDLTSASKSVTRQFGAIPWRCVDGDLQFLIITSRRTGRWIFPKGSLIEGLSPAENAAEEAFEEAGVRGRVGAEPLGRYHALKSGPAGGSLLSIEMYSLEVDKQLDDWPEKGERQRQWATLSVVKRRLSEPGLVAMAEKIAILSES